MRPPDVTNPGYLGAVADPCQNWPELIESNNTNVPLVLSEDTDIRYSDSGPSSGQDLPIEFVSVESLAAGQCVEQGVALSMPPPRPGAWYVGAVADPGLFLPELIESNNARASGAVQFQY